MTVEGAVKRDAFGTHSMSSYFHYVSCSGGSKGLGILYLAPQLLRMFEVGSGSEPVAPILKAVLLKLTTSSLTPLGSVVTSGNTHLKNYQCYFGGS